MRLWDAAVPGYAASGRVRSSSNFLGVFDVRSLPWLAHKIASLIRRMKELKVEWE
jgi:hypothetical protein